MKPTKKKAAKKAVGWVLISRKSGRSYPYSRSLLHADLFYTKERARLWKKKWTVNPDEWVICRLTMEVKPL